MLRSDDRCRLGCHRWAIIMWCEIVLHSDDRCRLGCYRWAIIVRFEIVLHNDDSVQILFEVASISSGP